MTRIVQALEHDHLVRRAHDPHDGRIVRIRATAKGRRVMQQGRARRIANLAGLLERLSAADVQRVREAAELVERALSQET
jgi:DNA-binding MarR family transcriptional regulator